MLYEDHLTALKSASLRHGTTGSDFDPALITDGLKAEREQGITIDVAYRYFSTAGRKFIIADTPGHEQYTRNMATGASTADLAIILIDARYGVLTQTRRHSTIVSLLGIRHVVVAINKMDLVGWDEARFLAIRKDYETFAARLGIGDVHVIPMAALSGDNVVDRSPHAPWYTGPALMEVLETVPVAGELDRRPFRMPVQLVSRPNQDFRGFAGTIAGGQITPGAAVAVFPSRQRATLARIVTQDGDRPSAIGLEAVTLTLAEEVDASRGDVIADPAHPPTVSHDVEAHVVWMAEAPLQVGRSYLCKHATNRTPAVVTAVGHRLDVNTQVEEPATTLQMNEIGVVRLRTTRPLVFDPYADNRMMGSFILIDRLTNATVGAGMIIRGLAAEDARERFDAALGSPAIDAEIAAGLVTPAERAARLGSQSGVIVLDVPRPLRTMLTRALVRRLFDLGAAPVVVDADEAVVRSLVEQGLLVIAPTCPAGVTHAVRLPEPTSGQTLAAWLAEATAELRGAGAVA